MTTIREILSSASNPALWNGYVHLMNPDHDTLVEYCNRTGNIQKIQALLVNEDGTSAGENASIEQTMRPRDFIQISTATLMKKANLNVFRGQISVAIHDVSGPDAPVNPAITTHWVSSISHCGVATQGLRYVNLPQAQRSKSFFMYCPVVVADASTTTLLVVMNASTDPQYADLVQLQPILRRPDGKSLEGDPVAIVPQGVAVINVVEHFGDAAEKFLASSNGRGSISISHIGHSFGSFFFHVDRKHDNVISGQHTQPPVYALTGPKVRWGKLRRYVLWP